MDSQEIPKNYFKLQIFCFKLMGISIENNDNSINGSLYTVYSFLVINICISLFLITEAIDLIMKWGDLDNMTFNLCYLITHFAGLCKAAVIMYQRPVIRRFYKQLEKGYFLPNYERGGVEEYRIISQAVRQTNLQTYIFYSLVTIIVANRAFYAGFDKGTYVTVKNTNNETIIIHYQLMPYTTWIPFDTNISPYYELAFTYQIIAVLIYGLLLGTCDSFIAGCMVHIKAQLLILKNSLRNYIERAKLNAKVNIKNSKSKYSQSKESYAELRKMDDNEKLNPAVQILVMRYLRGCIIHHQEIIHMVEVLESEFNYIMLIQFLGSILLLCLSLFQLSINDIKSTRFFSMICFACLMLFQLLIFCWNGNQVLEESLEIAFAAYDADWILCETEIQKALILIIQRSQRPLRISAGKFAYLTLETYMSILRASGSYYMVLRNVNE